MGWCNGSYLAEDIWQLIKEYLPEDKKPEIAKKIYDLFCDMDADDWQFEEGSLAALANSFVCPFCDNSGLFSVGGTNSIVKCNCKK